MHPIDYVIVGVYAVGMLAIGYHFMGRNEDAEDYYLAGRQMGSLHLGLSVVATDVGGGFSIGLGGLGFSIGLAGSWMLFTGLIGAWVSAVILIPKVKGIADEERFQTFPELFGHYYGAAAALIAGIISAVGYLGFSSSQVLAGAKLAEAVVGVSRMTALFVMGLIIIVYTVMGGLKAVIYTDTIQWAVLMIGLTFIAIPVGYSRVGGLEAMQDAVPAALFTFTNISFVRLVNWFVTIVPIWFVGMTLYQRIYAAKSEREAKRAWYLAGLFEWPVMAFMGVLLGLIARVAAEQGFFHHLGYAGAHALDAELGLPILLRAILPAGLMGLMVSAYLSAIMSTADSCLMAASGNATTDLIGRITPIDVGTKRGMRLSQIITLSLGAGAMLLASLMENVLELMLYSYAFMVSGLFVPVVGTLWGRPGRGSSAGSVLSMLAGGGTTLVLTVFVRSGALELPFKLDPNIFGIAAAAVVYAIAALATRGSRAAAGE